ncbi:flavin-binding monooxygenase-like protein (macronuclear) [Tetrahymena thermophila SB210]|uniref:Flavin-binding monooxygenase-like protein n=1 Tax=Tetrahymena thermophila (strain SB210) TaxID=312017 RepID=I7LVS5_TETTS|nr:flavin-binding monooxygenase-like protein [Tetrahymena thermophila SB210]EAR99628.1 flavin-binding monooxygenase-like protein [Tetrahymena thermophila SB210]|eukprot:XP_001019873.1 flavin-binding monooxygenase-like protein [Tetrahymena thermophila SB210]
MSQHTLQTSEFKYVNNYNLYKNSVLIIGAGPCGILSTKYISQNNNVLCVDGKNDIGGLWKFEEINENNHPNLQADAFYNSYGVLQSSLYEDLQSNDCKSMMCFKGLPPNREYLEFMYSDQFYSYLQQYSQKFNLKNYMTFNTFVQSVRLSKNLTQEEKSQLSFNLTKRFLIKLVDSADYNSNIRFVQADQVIVCNGHYSVPNYPNIENQQIFNGDLIHMHYFRKSKVEKYANRHLVIYGAGPSSLDVVLILLKRQAQFKPSRITVIGQKNQIQAQQKSSCYTEEMQTQRLVYKTGFIQKFNSPSSILLDSGEIIENVDNILYATGYQYSFPFLECNSQIDNIIEFYNERKNSFGPLYKRMFAVREPNLIFIGCVSTVFQLQSCLERQAIVAQRYIDNHIQLPSFEQMEESFKSDYEEACKASHDGKTYLKTTTEENGLTDFKYTKQLQQLAQIPLDEDFEKIYKEIVYPTYIQLLSNGNYPKVKDLNFEQLIGPDYSPEEGKF